MLRVILVLLVIFAIVTVVKRFVSYKSSGIKQPLQKPAKMLRCAYCEVFIPEDTVIEVGNKYYCCDEHARQATREEIK